jgi:dipeptide transport system substrate-binding protein
MNRTLSIAMIGAAALAVVPFAIAPAQAAKTLVYCSEGSPEGFNPALYTSGTTFDASGQAVYNRLVEFEIGTTKLIPGLATSWSVSKDGLSYTFKLRRGVKWHTTRYFKPTRDFNADDVLFSFNRQHNKKHPYHKVSGGTYEYYNGMDMPKLIKKVEKVDAYTVRFVLNKKEAPFIANMAMDFASIMSKEYADKMAKAGTKAKVDLEPIGTGPFQFVAYQKDAVIRYRAHPQYWRGKAKIDNLIFAITKSPSVRWAKLKAGECHIIPYPAPADLAAMKKDKSINVLEQEGLNVGYLAFNTEKKPFNNRMVRQALSMAIDKAAIIKAVFQGAGKAATNPIPPTMWSYNKNIKDYSYNPAKAKALLAKAGFPNGFTTDVWAMPVQRPYNPNARRMAEIIQANWAKIGVKAKIVTYEWGEYLKRSKNGEHSTVLLGWTGDNGDPDNFLHVLLGCAAAKSGPNRARWCHRPFDNLLMQAKATTNVDKRTALYMKAQQIFKTEAPWVTIAHSVVFMPMRKNVVGYKVHPLGSHHFYSVDLK